MYRHGALVLIAGLILCAAPAGADDEALPPPPPPTAPDSIIPSSPTSPSEAPLEPPPAAPDKLPPSGTLPPTGTLAPEDIPNPPVLPPTQPETPDTTEPGTPAPEAPTKKAETERKSPTKEIPSPPPPAAAETEVKPSNDLEKMLEPPKEEQKEVEVPPPAPIAETPPPSAPEKAEEPEARPPAAVSAIERGRQRHIPAYQKVQTEWAFQLSYSPGALGNGDIADASQGAKATGEQLSVEYQPKFLQQVGVIGFGPTLALYPIGDQFNVSGAGDASVWSLGAQVRYQARFFREQPLVPVAGFAWERLTYHLKNLGPAGATRDASSGIDMTGFFAGVWFLLNIVEPNEAAMSYLQSGLVRSYLTAELRSMSGSDDDVDVSGTSYFIGIRVEF